VDEFPDQETTLAASEEPPGTIIIDTQERHLYLIKDETHAVRYGIGRTACWPAPGGTARADPGIVDEDVEPIAVLPHDLGEAAHLGKRREVGRQEYRRAAASRPHLLEDLFAPPAIPSVDQDVSALVSKPARHQPTHAVRRPGHQCGLAFEVHAFRWERPFWS
jgi:hypothetical protein